MSPSRNLAYPSLQGGVLLALAFACGVALRRVTAAAPLVCLALVAASAALTIILVLLRRDRASCVMVIVAFAALGAFDASLASRTPPDSVARLLASRPAGFLARFEGIVLTRTAAARGSFPARYNCRLTSLASDAGPVGVSGLVLLDSSDDIPYGAAVTGAAFFHLPPSAASPGAFDYRAWLAGEGVSALARAGVMDVTALPRRFMIGRTVASVRRLLTARLASLGLDAAGVIPAVLLADRSSIDSSVRDTFVRSGTMHLLAISGLHLAIVAGFFFFVLRLCRLPLKPASVATLIVAACYILVVGARPPVLRAGLMLALFCAGILLDRPVRTLSVVSASALVMLVLRPLSLFNAGFQLSFVAVLSLAYIGVPLGGFLSRVLVDSSLPLKIPLAAVARILGMSTGAALAVAPLTALHFGVVSFIAPLANLLLIPVTWAMLVAGFAALASSYLSAPVAAFFASSASGAETVLLAVSALLSRVPCSYAYMAVSPFAAWACYVSLVAIAVSAAFVRFLAPVLIAALAAAGIFVFAHLASAPIDAPETFRLTGDRAVVAFLYPPRNAVILLGRGASPASVSSLLVPALLSRGVERIPLVVETAGADARIADSLSERIPVTAVARQRRFQPDPDAPPPPVTTPLSLAVGPGDAVSVDSDVTLAFHAVRPPDFTNPADRWFEGLVVDITSGGHRSVVTLDTDSDASLFLPDLGE